MPGFQQSDRILREEVAIPSHFELVRLQQFPNELIIIVDLAGPLGGTAGGHLQTATFVSSVGQPVDVAALHHNVVSLKVEQESRLFEGEGNQVVGCLSVEVELLGKGSLKEDTSKDRGPQS